MVSGITVMIFYSRDKLIILKNDLCTYKAENS